MTYDSHIHTSLCKHATGGPADYLRAARRAQLAGLVFTDHAPTPDGFDSASRMAMAELRSYCLEIDSLRSQNPGFYVGIGLEADYRPGHEPELEKQFAEYHFDYLIGSIHHLGDWPFDHPDYQHEFTQRDLSQVYKSYFALIAQAAGSLLFDSIGHFDLPKKFGYLPEGGYADLAEPALQAIVSYGTFLDFNTAGWRKPCAEPYPSFEILVRAHELDIGVVLGSDAHDPGEVGHRFGEAIAMLRRAGYQEAWVFRERQPAPYPLPKL